MSPQQIYSLFWEATCGCYGIAFDPLTDDPAEVARKIYSLFWESNLWLLWKFVMTRTSGVLLVYVFGLEVFVGGGQVQDSFDQADYFGYACPAKRDI